MISGSLYDWYYLWLYQIRHFPFPFVGPCVLLSTFLSNMPIFLYTITALALAYLRMYDINISPVFSHTGLYCYGGKTDGEFWLCMVFCSYLSKLLSIEGSILEYDKQEILNCLFLFLHECGNVSQKFLLTFWVYVRSCDIILARIGFYYCFCEFGAVTFVIAKSWR